MMEKIFLSGKGRNPILPKRLEERGYIVGRYAWNIRISSVILDIPDKRIVLIAPLNQFIPGRKIIPGNYCLEKILGNDIRAIRYSNLQFIEDNNVFEVERNMAWNSTFDDWVSLTKETIKKWENGIYYPVINNPDNPWGLVQIKIPYLD